MALRSPRPGHPTSVGISNANLGMERRGASPFDHALVTLSPRPPAILVRECPRRSVRADEREPHGFFCALFDRARAIRPATSGRQPLHARPRRWARSCPADGRPAHRRVTLRSDSAVAYPVSARIGRELLNRRPVHMVEVFDHPGLLRRVPTQPLLRQHTRCRHV